MGIIAEIIKIQRSFLWSGSSGRKAVPLVPWNTIQLPKMFGGLNVGNLHHHNLSLLFKWLWRYLNEPNALWRQVIQLKYKLGPSFTLRDLVTPK